MIILQLTVAISVLWVWFFRKSSVTADFERFNLSTTTKKAVGMTKIVLACLMLMSIWASFLVYPAAIGMAFMMICAQYYHWRASSTLLKRIPSLLLLVLSCLIMF